MGALRIYLAISVVFHHCRFSNYASPTHMDGGVSVLLFFIISGFYISYIFNEKYSKLENPIKTFYTGRFLRIFPLYLVILAFAILFFRSINQPSVFTSQLHLSDGFRGFLVLSNVFIFGQDFFNIFVEDMANKSPLSNHIFAFLQSQNAADIASNPVYVLIGQAWSLSIELIFYAVAPFVVTRKKLVISLLLSSLVLRYIFYAAGFPPVPYQIRFFPTVFVFFLLGNISYFLYKELQLRKLPMQTIGGGILLVATLFVVSSAHHNIGILPGANFDTPSHWLLYIAITLAIPFLFAYSKNSPIDNFLGEFSYPVYLVHGLILGYMVQPIQSLSVSGPILVAVYSLFFSWLLIFTVVKPCDAIKIRILKNRTTLEVPPQRSNAASALEPSN